MEATTDCYMIGMNVYSSWKLDHARAGNRRELCPPWVIYVVFNFTQHRLRAVQVLVSVGTVG